MYNIYRFSRQADPSSIVLGPAMMGAPAVVTEKMLGVSEIRHAVETAAQLYEIGSYDDATGILHNAGQYMAVIVPN